MFRIGPKLNTVFASRWRAAMWSLGVLVTAYCTVPAADPAKTAPLHHAAAPAAQHKSPWAKD